MWARRRPESERKPRTDLRNARQSDDTADFHERCSVPNELGTGRPNSSVEALRWNRRGYRPAPGDRIDSAYHRQRDCCRPEGFSLIMEAGAA
jgi:hypothetical protein